MVKLKQKPLINEELETIVLEQLASENKIELDTYALDEFSAQKSLLEYQQDALQNAFNILNLFFNACGGDKEEFYSMLRGKYAFKNLDIKLEKDSLLTKYFKVSNGVLDFAEVVNQMCFWMATGSGKTIVIIKLIEMLARAMDSGLIPFKDIFFFSANEDLLEAFKQEVEAYNTGKDTTIKYHSLKDYEGVKKELNKQESIFKTINVFLYSAYNLTSESKEKQLDFKEVWNNGDNYVILDEAHKGNKSYSKMQHIMNILSQNGFLFNFSATFTSSQDIAMTVLNLNAVEWIQKGYGKKPILFKDSDLSALKEKEDFNERAKQKAILKSLIALYLCKESRINCHKDSYHDPMMLVFANSVTAENSDGHIFFKTLQSIINHTDQRLFKEAKEELAKDLKKEDYLVKTEDNVSFEFLSKRVLGLELNAVKEQVFHSCSGNLEAIYYPSNTNEILFKLDSVEIPFMLIRIGNIIEWLRVNLKGIKITKSYKDLEAFKNIDNSPINILLGSRMFSEGWNTTRPNVTLFLNIGVDKEAKTFITQSLGRTLRIESFNKDRRRAGFIEGDQEANSVLETSFIFATNPTAIKAVIEATKVTKISRKCTIKLEKNPLVASKNLLIPKYKVEKKQSNKIAQGGKIRVSKQNEEIAKIYANNASNALLALRHNLRDAAKVKLVKELCCNGNFNVSDDKHYKSIDSLISEVAKRSFVRVETFDSFKKIENEIIHYEKIAVKEGLQAKVEEEIQKTNASKRSKTSLQIKGAHYKYLEKHYYNPLICERDSINFSYIVKVESEIKFLEALDDLNEKIDKEVEWWFFSKIDANVDSVYIPYTQDAQDRRFYPDFVFWIKKRDGSKKIVFVDPKGTQNTAYEFKCDGFKNVFGVDFKKEDVKVELWFIKDDKAVSEGYAKYWIDLRDEKELMRIFK